MKHFGKIIAFVFLLFNGSAAIYGGLNLIIYPDGSKIWLSTDLLQNSVFENFLLPGVMLFMIGLFSIYTMVAVIISFKKYWVLVMMQGTILALWLVIQLVIIRTITIPHLVMLIVAFLLILTGNAMMPYKNEYKSDGL